MTRAWNWWLSIIWCQDYEYIRLCLHFVVYFHGWSTRITVFFLLLYQYRTVSLQRRLLFLCSIIQCCHVVFFKQLCSWLLYGQLIDQYGEFFIHRASDTQGTSTSTTLDSFSSQDIHEMLSVVCFVLLSFSIIYYSDSCDCFASKVLLLQLLIVFGHLLTASLKPTRIMCWIQSGSGFMLQQILSIQWIWIVTQYIVALGIWMVHGVAKLNIQIQCAVW